MITAGSYHTLTVARVSPHGLYLADAEGNEVLLPNRFCSLSDKEGDSKEVFVYHDSENRPVATTERPVAVVGECAMMEVRDKSLHGAFLAWGVAAKELFLPNRNQQGRVEIGESVPVYVYYDDRSGRSVATMFLKDYIVNSGEGLKPHQKVDIFVAVRTERGYRVVIGNKCWGMIYANEIFRPIAIGDRMEAYVKRVTDEGRVDLTLGQGGVDELRGSADELRRLLSENGGILPIGDNSAPEEITRLTGMSKKSFKRAAGTLLKGGEVVIEPLRLVLK